MYIYIYIYIYVCVCMCVCIYIYIYISAVKWLIAINYIQNKSFCLHYTLTGHFIRYTWGTFKFTPVPNVLLRFLGWTCFLETVCNGVWDTFSLVWWVCHKCEPNQQQHEYKPRGIKVSSHTGFIQVKSFTNVSAAARYAQQLKILEDMFVVRVL